MSGPTLPNVLVTYKVIFPLFKVPVYMIIINISSNNVSNRGDGVSGLNCQTQVKTMSSRPTLDIS